MRFVGRKGAREVRGVKHGRVVRGLQAVAEDDVRQEEFERPLILLIAPWSAEGNPRLATAERESRAQGGARPFAAFDAVGVIGIEVEHLRPRPEAETQAVDHRRALQPASAWVHATRFPWRSATATRTVSPRTPPVAWDPVPVQWPSSTTLSYRRGS